MVEGFNSNGYRLSHPLPGEEVVITGLAGVYPECDNVYELRDKLFNKVDLITEDERRWRPKHPDVPQRAGKINGVTKFDREFFEVSEDEAEWMDPMARINLETCYGAIIDAGVSPKDLYGTNTGVYAGACFSEAEMSWFYNKQLVDGNGITGCSRAMLANRVSWWLNLKGPSLNVDTACSSSLYAIDQAYRDIRDGICDNAIVIGTNLCFSPITTLQFARLGVLSKDGRCYSFDSRGQGYVRSETICAVFLQKAQNAKRIYAQIIHSKTNCDGYKPRGITFPSQQIQEQLLSEFYEECCVKPETVNFVEAHGTGTFVGDPEEAKTIENVFCTNRVGALKIGSIKSNLGHSEPASGIAGLSKALIAFETGIIAPNLNYINPRTEILALQEGRLKIPTETTPLDGPLIAINSFGFGGANAHVLLKRHSKISEQNSCPLDDIPRLVTVSGRTNEAVAVMLSDLESRPLNAEFVRLLHDIHKEDIRGHQFRGYTLLQKGAPRSIVKKIDAVEPKRRPVWFVFSGVGSQWPDMASSLMVLPPFMAAINTCGTVLQTTGIDLKEILTTKDPQVFDNILHTFVAVAAVQIGLVDVLTTLGVVADHVLGHSIGEFGCAYAEGKLTAEETILTAYSSGLNLSTNNLSNGRKICNDLNKNAIKSTSKVMNWFQTLMTNNQWNGHQVKHEPDDFKLKNVVLQRNFEEKFQKIHPDAIVIEVGPNALFQRALRTKAPDSVIHAVLTRANFNNTVVLLKAIGTLYNYGLNPQLSSIYPDINFPVSRGTPMISPLIRWNHDKDWRIPIYDIVNEDKSAEQSYEITIKDDKYSFITGHVIDGRNLYPATGYLFLVWDLVAKMNGESCELLKVVFDGVNFIRATNVPKQGEIILTVMVQKGSGYFEVSEGDAPVVTGTVKAVHESQTEDTFELPPLEPDLDKCPLNQRDIYKVLRLRGYNYSGLFKAITQIDGSGRTAMLEWNNNWAAFMDTMLQMQILQRDEKALLVPTSIQTLIIDPIKHLASIQDDNDSKFLPAYYYENYGIVKSGGIEIRGLQVNTINRRKPLGEPVLEKQQFVPFFNGPQLNIYDALRVCLHLALDITPAIRVKVVEVDDLKNEPIVAVIQTVLGDLPLIQAEINLLSPRDLTFSNKITVLKTKIEAESNAMFVIHSNLSQNPQALLACTSALRKGSYIISRENSSENSDAFKDYDVLTEVKTDSETFMLIRPKIISVRNKKCVQITDNSEFSWLSTVKNAMKESNSTILYSQNEPLSGLIGFLNCVRKESNGSGILGMLILDERAPRFDAENPFYSHQLDKGLPVNIYQDGQWGSFRHLQLEERKIMASHVFVNVTTRGDLSSLSWLQGSADPSDERFVTIHYSALNFRDVMNATGKLSVDLLQRDTARIESDLESVLGFEFAGIDRKGRRVMGILGCGGLASGVIADPDLMIPVPDSWTLEEAATVPVVYATAIRALVFNGMRAGHKVLIHAGSGGVGLAAITLALHYGCTVFTTVGTPEKKAFVLEQFPQLKESHIGNSRDTTFEQMVMVETNGQGVDFVLNSLADEKLQASLRCLGVGGKFLEIGKFDMSKNTGLEMRVFAKGTSFHSIMLDNIFYGSELEKRRCLESVIEGIQAGAIKPLRRTIFKKNEIEQAFRYMAVGKHVGKVLIDMGISNQDIPKLHPSLATPKTYCDPTRSYIIIGGLGGFGLELTHRLIERGACKIILSSRRGVSSGYQDYMIHLWKKYRIQVQISTANVATVEGCRALLQTALAMGPVDGIFNLAVVLRDALLENQTVEKFREAFAGKALATQHLDQLSREMCAELRHFVVFSSVSCGRGNAGQSNYGMANSVMERVCERRHAQGLPALAVQWGAIGEVGLVADMQENDTLLEIGGTLQQSLASCLQVLDVVLTQREAPVVASMVVAEKKYGGGHGGCLVDTVCSILGLRDVKTVSIQSNLAELGMDSMMSVEIKQTLEREFEIFLSAQEIRALTIAKLLEYQTVENMNIINEEDNQEDKLSKMLQTIGDGKSINIPSIVELPSLTQLDNSRAPLILIPGIEGQSSIFEPLCQHLHSRTFSTQIGFDIKCSTIPQLAEYLYPAIEAKLKPSEEFQIIGYSYGALIAIELSRIFEAAGRKGRVLLLDGGPLLSAVFTPGKDTEITVLGLILRHLNVTNETVDALRRCSTWEDKLDLLEELLPPGVPYTTTYVRLICDSIYRRVLALQAYNPEISAKIDVPIALLKPKNAVIVNVAADYNLSSITKHPVPITVIDGDHFTMLENPELYEMIQRYFSVD